MGEASLVTIRPMRPGDEDAVWRILKPMIRAGETYPLPRDMSRANALAHWSAADREAFVAEDGDALLGTYYLRANQTGGGAHVANCGYVTAADAAGRGVASRMCVHSLERARTLGFTAMQFNFVISTNARAVALWRRQGFAEVGRLPGAFRHPRLGEVDALVMYRRLCDAAPAT